MNKLAKTWPLKVFIRKSVVNQSYKSTTTTSNRLPNPPTSINHNHLKPVAKSPNLYQPQPPQTGCQIPQPPSTTTTSNRLPNPPTSIKSQLVANRLRISASPHRMSSSKNNIAVKLFQSSNKENFK